MNARLAERLASFFWPILRPYPLLSSPILPYPTHSSRNAKPPAPAGSNPAGSNPAGIPSGRIQQEYRPAGIPSGRNASGRTTIRQEYHPIQHEPVRQDPIRQEPALKLHHPAGFCRILQDFAGFCTIPLRIRPFLWEEHHPLSWTWEVFRRHHFLGFRTVPRTTLSEAAVPT